MILRMVVLVVAVGGVACGGRSRSTDDGGPAVVDDGGPTVDGSTVDGSTVDGSTVDGGTDDGGSDADACLPITTDTSAIGRDCADGAPCPDGYTCQGFSGVIFAQSCQILCDADCQCPLRIPGACAEITDKAGTWRQCEVPKI